MFLNKHQNIILCCKWFIILHNHVNFIYSILRFLRAFSIVSKSEIFSNYMLLDATDLPKFLLKVKNTSPLGHRNRSLRAARRTRPALSWSKISFCCLVMSISSSTSTRRSWTGWAAKKGNRTGTLEFLTQFKSLHIKMLFHYTHKGRSFENEIEVFYRLR